MNVEVADVVALIRDKLGSRATGMPLGADTRFDSTGLSSLQIADIVYTIEDDAGVEFDPSRAADVATVQDLVDMANALAQAR